MVRKGRGPRLHEGEETSVVLSLFVVRTKERHARMSLSAVGVQPLSSPPEDMSSGSRSVASQDPISCHRVSFHSDVLVMQRRDFMMKYGDATRYLEFAAAQTYMLLARSASGGKSVAIIIVSKNGHKAHKVERSTFDKEDNLQRYLRDNPEALPIDQIRDGAALWRHSSDFSEFRTDLSEQVQRAS